MLLQAHSDIPVSIPRERKNWAPRGERRSYLFREIFVCFLLFSDLFTDVQRIQESKNPWCHSSETCRCVRQWNREEEQTGQAVVQNGAAWDKMLAFEWDICYYRGRMLYLPPYRLLLGLYEHKKIQEAKEIWSWLASYLDPWALHVWDVISWFNLGTLGFWLRSRPRTVITILPLAFVTLFQWVISVGCLSTNDLTRDHWAKTVGKLDTYRGRNNHPILDMQMRNFRHGWRPRLITPLDINDQSFCSGWRMATSGT